MELGLQDDLGLQGAWLLHRAFATFVLLRCTSGASRGAGRL